MQPFSPRKSACYQCTKRFVGCHSVCKDYEEFSKRTEKFNKDVRDKKRYESLTNNGWGYNKKRHGNI